MLKIIKYSISVIIIFIILTLSIFYFFLLKGIEIRNISFQNSSIEKLYIKIDKKLIVRAKKIIINRKSKIKKNKLNFNEIDLFVKKVLQTLQLFQEIVIEQLSINGNRINYLSFKDNLFTLDTDKIFLTATIIPKRRYNYIKIDELNLKPLNNTILYNLRGKITTNLKKVQVVVNGEFANTLFKIEFKIFNNKKFEYSGVLENINLTLLKKFKQYLPKKVKISKLNIDRVDFSGNLKNFIANLNKFNTKLDNNNITLNGEKLQLHYPFEKEKILINLKKLQLSKGDIKSNLYNSTTTYFIKSGTTEGSISKMEIKRDDIKLLSFSNYFKYNKTLTSTLKLAEITLLNQHRFILNNLKLFLDKEIVVATTPFIIIKDSFIDATAKDAVVNYNLKKDTIYGNLLNFEGKYGLTSLNTDRVKVTYNPNKGTIKIPKIVVANNLLNIDNFFLLFEPKSKEVKIDFKSNSILSKQLKNFLKEKGLNLNIYQAGGENRITGKIIYNLEKKNLLPTLDINITNSPLFITPETYLLLKKANLKIDNKKIEFQNSDVEFNKSIVNLNYLIKNGELNFQTLLLNLLGNIKKVELKKILTIKKFPEKIGIDLRELLIKLKNLKTDIKIGDKLYLNLKSIALFKKYIPYLDKYKIDDGNLSIKIGKKIDIDSNIKTSQTILEQNLTPLKNLEIKGCIDGNKTTIKHKNLRVIFEKKKDINSIFVGIKNADLNITQFLEENRSSNDKNETDIQLEVKGVNSNIILNQNRELYSKKLYLYYDKNRTFAQSLYKDRNISVIGNNKTIKIYGLNIGDKTYNELIRNNILNKPKLNFFAIYNKELELTQGFVEIKKGYIKELKAFNNIVAFINMIPSLVTFKPVGFSSKGYKIKNGYSDFIFYNKLLYIKNLNIIGENMSFDGNGYIDFKKKTLKFNINVNLIVKLIKEIPIVSYILLGDDGGITIRITIDGSIDNPKVHSNTASNIIEAPMGIIKRTLLTPFRPFMKKKEK